MRHNKNRRASYAQEDVNGKLIFNLLDINHTIRGLYEGRGSQKGVLMALSETGTITQRELTERLGIQPGSASEVISKLENAKLIARAPSKADRRTADISLTDEGRERAAEAKSQRVQRHIEMFSILSEDEKIQLLALLERVNADWEARYGQRLKHHHGRHRNDEGLPHEKHGEKDGHRGCNHDCANCPSPCSKGKAQLERDR